MSLLFYVCLALNSTLSFDREKWYFKMSKLIEIVLASPDQDKLVLQFMEGLGSGNINHLAEDLEVEYRRKGEAPEIFLGHSEDHVLVCENDTDLHIRIDGFFVTYLEEGDLVSVEMFCNEETNIRDFYVEEKNLI